MDLDPCPVSSAATPCRQRRRVLKALGLLGIVAAIYLGLAYVLVPTLWKSYFRRHPALENVPRITHAADGLPGDPLNIALVGSETELKRIMLLAKWYPADPLTWRSCLRIAEGTILHRPYEDAPVSNLYLWGRREDLAFEQPVGDDPRRRHHVRFWRSAATEDGRSVWMGAATYDTRVGFSHTTGEITHHIAADVDAERDHLLNNLESTADLAAVHLVDDFHQVRQGRNGGGDPWHTDGKLYIGVIKLEPLLIDQADGDVAKP